MKLQVYKIITPNTIDTDLVYSTLADIPVMTSLDKWKFAIVNLQKNSDYVFGLLGQESDELLFEYDDNKNRNDLDNYRWYETFFVLDIKKADVYIHKYAYKPNNLNHRTTVTRIEDLLSRVYFTKYYYVVKLMPYREGINADEFKQLFYDNQIIELKFSDIKGK